MEKINWQRAAAITVTLLGATVGIYLLGRYAVALLMPFLVALVLSLITRPLVRRLVGWGWNERAAAATVTALALLAFGALGYLLCSRLFLELRQLLLFLAEDSKDPAGKLATLSRTLRELWQRLPFVEHLRGADFLQYFIEDAEGFFERQLTEALARLSARITDLAVGVVSALPSVLLFLLVTLISCFYFAMDYGTVGRAARRFLPQRWREGDWRERTGRAVRRYLRAYLLLFLLTAAELLIGFLLLSVDYAVLLALITAVLDALPVLGVGIVLIPYAILSFAMGNTATGIGLLILYGVITVVRQIAEPRLVGKSLGLHPILMLIAFYAGWRLFGVAGVLIGPLLAMVIKSLAARGAPEQ